MPATDRSRYTFVTVFYEREYEQLLLQARSFRIYCDPDLVEKIIVVDNSERPLPRNWRQRLLSEYGDLAARVEIVHAHDISRLPWCPGWRAQQILKLMVAHIVPTERYVLFDSKNHLISPMRRDAIEAADGRPLSHLHGYSGHPLQGHFEHVLKVYGLDPAVHIDRFGPTATPFVMYTGIVRDMITDMSRRTGRSFEDAFERVGLTEFFGYHAYIISRSGRDLGDLYDFSQVQPPCIWAHSATRSQTEEILASTASREIPFFAVHHVAIANLDGATRDIIAKFWHERSLFASPAHATEFLDRLQAQYRKPVWDSTMWRALKTVVGFLSLHPKRPPALVRS